MANIAMRASKEGLEVSYEALEAAGMVDEMLLVDCGPSWLWTRLRTRSMGPRVRIVMAIIVMREDCHISYNKGQVFKGHHLKIRKERW